MFASMTANGQWVQTNGIFGGGTIRSLAVKGNNVFAGTYRDNQGNGCLFRSTDNGFTWTKTALDSQNIMSFAINGEYIFAGSMRYGVYISTNNGLNWNQTALNNQSIYSLSANGNNIFAGT